MGAANPGERVRDRRTQRDILPDGEPVAEIPQPAEATRRSAISKRTGNVVGEELLKRNYALVKYLPPDSEIIDVVS